MLTKKYILECLDSYCTFENLHEDNFVEQIVRPLQINNCFKENHWTYDNGVTKGVLIFKGLDFVIKIPFMGRTCWTESHYEDSQGNWLWNKRSCTNIKKIEAEECFYEFEGAAEEGHWNYCEEEAILAEHAKERGLTKCFAITELFGWAKDHPIYIQERCFMFSEASSSNEEKYKNRTKSDYDSLKEVREKLDFWHMNNDWVLDFLIYWGEEVLKKLGDFIWEYNIDDLHNGNIGYRNGVPCLVDYSSFRD